MSVTFVKKAVVACSVLALSVSVGAGCNKGDGDEAEATKDKDEESETEETDEPEPEPEPEPTTKLEPETETPGITPRIKSELDGRKDGAEGSTLSVSGAGATLTTPKEWTTEKSGTFQIAKGKDEKATFAATSKIAKVEEAGSELGLSECNWGVSETVTVGEDELKASAADGTCKKGGADVPAFQVTFTDESLLVVGAFEEGADEKGLFDSLRAVKKAGGKGDPSGIAACCSALRQNSKSAPPHQKGAYIAAAGACDAVRANAQGRAALGQVRALLAGANVPPPCR